LRFIDEEITFIHPDDLSLYNEWESRSLELQVANHELLGHGSGKLFQESADGSKNFDPEKVCEPCPEYDRNLKLDAPDN
jgi:dipeptidyl-peptidase-3